SLPLKRNGDGIDAFHARAVPVQRVGGSWNVRDDQVEQRRRHPHPAPRQALTARPSARCRLSETASVSCWPSRPLPSPWMRGSPPGAYVGPRCRWPGCITPCPPRCRLRGRTAYRAEPTTPEPTTPAVDPEAHLPTRGSGATPRHT